METEVEAESAALAATEPKIEVVEVKPTRAGVSVRLIALGWIPQTQVLERRQQVKECAAPGP